MRTNVFNVITLLHLLQIQCHLQFVREFLRVPVMRAARFVLQIMMLINVMSVIQPTLSRLANIHPATAQLLVQQPVIEIV